MVLGIAHPHYRFKIDIGKKYAILSSSSKQHIRIAREQTITFEACWPFKANSNTHLFGSKRTNKKLLYKTTATMDDDNKTHTALQIITVDKRVLIGTIQNNKSEDIVLEPGEMLTNIFWFVKDVY